MTSDERLIDIAEKVATIQATLESMKDAIARNNAEDAKFDARLEKYFEYTKTRQDSIKRELEGRIDAHEARITALEQNKSKKLVKWWDWCWDKLVAAGLILIGALIYKWLNLPKL